MFAKARESRKLTQSQLIASGETPALVQPDDLNAFDARFLALYTYDQTKNQFRLKRSAEISKDLHPYCTTDTYDEVSVRFLQFDSDEDKDNVLLYLQDKKKRKCKKNIIAYFCGPAKQAQGITQTKTSTKFVVAVVFELQVFAPTVKSTARTAKHTGANVSPRGQEAYFYDREKLVFKSISEQKEDMEEERRQAAKRQELEEINAAITRQFTQQLDVEKKSDGGEGKVARV